MSSDCKLFIDDVPKKLAKYLRWAKLNENIGNQLFFIRNKNSIIPFDFSSQRPVSFMFAPVSLEVLERLAIEDIQSQDSIQEVDILSFNQKTYLVRRMEFLTSDFGVTQQLVMLHREHKELSRYLSDSMDWAHVHDFGSVDTIESKIRQIEKEIKNLEDSNSQVYSNVFLMQELQLPNIDVSIFGTVTPWIRNAIDYTVKNYGTYDKLKGSPFLRHFDGLNISEELLFSIFATIFYSRSNVTNCDPFLGTAPMGKLCFDVCSSLFEGNNHEIKYMSLPVEFESATDKLDKYSFIRVLIALIIFFIFGISLVYLNSMNLF
ncbi:MAG: hypothetical protein AB7I27_00105 [Bacteriovoracaceae bacterium]